MRLKNWTWNNRLVKNWEKSTSRMCFHTAYLTYMQSTSCKMLGWMKHKLESSLPGEISITSYMQMAPPLWQKVKNWRASWLEGMGGPTQGKGVIMAAPSLCATQQWCLASKASQASFHKLSQLWSSLVLSLQAIFSQPTHYMWNLKIWYISMYLQISNISQL